MTNERMKILNMVSEGKLSAEEASQLLASINRLEELEVEPVQANVAASAEATLNRQPELAAASQPEQTPDHNHAPEHKPEHNNSTNTPGLSRLLKGMLSSVGLKEKYLESFEYEIDGTEITAISAQTTNGPIEFTGSDSSQILIRVEKQIKAPTVADAEAFAQQVQIRVEPVDDALRIYKEHPKPPRGYEVHISYRIEAPREMNLAMRTTNGEIKTHAATGVIEAKTTNGTIKLHDIAGQVMANTTNGNVEADVAQLQQASHFTTTNGSVEAHIQSGIAGITAHTSNGSIDLQLPANFTAKVNAKTVNGSIHTDFEPTQIEHQKRNQLIAHIGTEAEVPLHVKTVNGGITLARL